MRTLLNFLASLSFALPAYADIAVHDLPYLEGTPLVQDSDTSWTLLDHAEAEDGFAWAWLEKAGHLAYVVYPTSSASVTFPDGTLIDTDPENVVLQFLGKGQRLEFTRFGGLVVLQGNDIRATYAPAPQTGTDAGIIVELSSDQSLTIMDTVPVATLTATDGQIESIAGTNSADTLAAPSSTVNYWSIDGHESTLKIGDAGEEIRFSAMEKLRGGALEDRFTLGLVTTSLWLDGGAGANTLIATSPDILSPDSNCPDLLDLTLGLSGAENLLLKTPCAGDFLIHGGEIQGDPIPPSANTDNVIVIPAEENISPSVETNSSQNKSNGGSTSGWFIGLLALLRVYRRNGGSR